MKRGLDEDGRSLSAEKDRQRAANVLKAKLQGDRTGKPGMLDSQLLEQIGLKVEGLTPLAFLCLLPVVNRLDMILSAQKEDEVPVRGFAIRVGPLSKSQIQVILPVATRTGAAKGIETVQTTLKTTQDACMQLGSRLFLVGMSILVPI